MILNWYSLERYKSFKRRSIVIETVVGIDDVEWYKMQRLQVVT